MESSTKRIPSKPYKERSSGNENAGFQEGLESRNKTEAGIHRSSMDDKKVSDELPEWFKILKKAVVKEEKKEQED